MSIEQDSLRSLGRVVRLQIQRSNLKLGEKPNRYYDPAPILPVDELTLTPEGALARLPDGRTLVDIHHAAHPNTRNRDRTNDVSVGFTPHYAAMRQRFGPHLVDGCAGENILVETAALARITLADLAGGLVIRPAGRERAVTLGVLGVDPPCVEFSGYAARDTAPESIKQALQFLDDGLRGFYCALLNPGSALVTIGDEVLVRFAAVS
jgi:MOSC domain-containing protein